MKRKKINLSEEIKKLSEIASLLKEAAPVQASQQAAQQPAQQGAQTQQQGQRAPQQPQPQQAGQPQLNPQNIEKTMDQGMNSLIQQLPNILKNFTATAGDKDGQLDIAGQQQAQQPQQQAQQPQAQQGQVKESAQMKELKFDENKFKSHLSDEMNEGGIMGLVASAPAIMQLGGKLIGWTGKKVNSNLMQKWGKNVADAGHKLHHKYIGVLEKVITPFMKNSSKEDVHKAAEAMFMTLVAGLFAGGLTAPDFLTGVKGQELAQYVGKIAPKALGGLGFS
jgi:hypothetical protein